MKRPALKRKPPSGYMQVGLVWRVAQLTRTRQLEWFRKMDKDYTRIWWEWTLDGWREIQ